MSTSSARPNIIFMHSHNTGRLVQPYGHAFPAPNLQRLAENGVLFRQAYSAAPTCSPSRASFLTGMYPHSCGMYGLAHRGFALDDYSVHIAQVLGRNGYETALSGVEHIATRPQASGYHHVLSAADTNYPEGAEQPDPVGAAVEFVCGKHDTPFFLSLGLNQTHRPYEPADPANHPAEDARYCAVPSSLPDIPAIRQEVADLKASVRKMDESYGAVLDALGSADLRDSTLVFAFTDHGPEFPNYICNLTDGGIAVYLIISGPPVFKGGLAVDGLVSLVDLVPTVYDVAGIDTPSFVDGVSLCGSLSAKSGGTRQAIFAESNYHAAYEPTRCVRTQRYKYIRRYDDRHSAVLPNIDDSITKRALLDAGLADRPRDQEMLYDLVFDRGESNNIASEPAMTEVLTAMRNRLQRWMQDTNDPLVDGDVPVTPHSIANNPDDKSPKDPTHRVLGADGNRTP